MGGARIRTIKPETWDDEVIGGLSCLARLTFYGLISIADDEGRGRAGAAFLKSRLHPHASTVSSETVRVALDELAATRRVMFYEIDGENFYQVKNFRKHQVINKPSKSSLPPPSYGSTTGGLPEDYRKTTDGSESTGPDRTVRDRTGPDRSLRGEPPSPDAPTGAPPTATGQPRPKTPSPELSLDEINYRRKLAGWDERPEDSRPKEPPR